MAVTWTIEGQAGEGWDATSRTLPQLGIRDGTVTTGSIAEDGIRLDCALGDYAGTTYPRPTEGQRVTLKRNGNVWFRGWVVGPQASAGDAFRPSLSVPVLGPGYWLKKQPLRSSRQAPGFVAAASRNQMVFPSGNTLSDNLALLVAAYNDTLGGSDARRISLGSVATTYALPLITVSGGNFLSTLERLMEFIPDGQAFWTYQSGSHQAALTVTRRGTMTTRTIAAGGIAQGAAFRRRFDMEADAGVVIDFAEMIDDGGPNTGRPQYLQQASSAAFSGAVTATARGQRYTTAGPEGQGFLPDSPTDSSTVSSSVISRSFIATNDPALAAIPNAAADGAIQMFGAVARDTQTGANLSTSHPYVLTLGEPRDWWRLLASPILTKAANIMVSCQIGDSGFAVETGWYGVNFSQGSTYPWGYYQRPAGISGGYRVFQQTAMTEAQWRFWQIAAVQQRTDNVATGSGLYQASTRYWGTYQAKVAGTMANQLLSNATVYKRPDFKFYAPPANLANNLSAAQNFAAWEGRGSVLQSDPGAVAFAGCKLNATGFLSEWSTMGAMVNRHEIELFSGKETVHCGPPPRLTNLDLTTRLPVDPQSQIFYI